MMKQTDLTLKVLLAMLVAGVWGLVLRPLFSTPPAQAQAVLSTPGRFVMQRRDSGYMYMLDTATGTIKETWVDNSGAHTLTQTWDKNYVNGAETVGPVVSATTPAAKKP